MTRFGKAALLALPLWCCAALVWAGGLEEAVLPKRMAVDISVRSPQELFESIDAGVAAASAGTPDPIEEGTVLEWAERNLPFLVGMDGMDCELHIYLPPVASGAVVMGAVGVLARADFARLVEVLELNGAHLDPMRQEGRITFTLAGSMPIFAHDAGDGVIIIAMNVNAIRMIQKEVENGWRPTHWADGTVGILADKPGKWLFTGASLDEKFAMTKAWLTVSQSSALDGADGKVLAALVDAVATEALPGLREEIAGIERLGLDIRVDGKRLGMGLHVQSLPGSLLGEIAAATADKKNIDESPLIRNADAEAIQVLAQAGPEEILPGLGERFLSWSERIVARAFPDQKDAYVAAGRAFLAGGPGESVNAGYFRDRELGNAIWTRADDAAALADGTVKLAAVVGDMMKRAFPGYCEGDVVSVSDVSTPDGVTARRIAWDQMFMARYTGFSLALVSSLNDAPVAQSAALPWLRNAPEFLIAPVDGMVLMASGPGNAERLDAMVRKDASGPPLVAEPSAATALAELRRQNVLALTNYDFIMPLLASAHPQVATGAVDFEELRSSFRTTESLVGLAWGVRDNVHVFDLVFPTDVINALYYNYSVLELAGVSPETANSASLRGKRDMYGLKANEADAARALKSYAIAQVTFNIGRQGRDAANTGAGEFAMADNFRNLYYGKAVDARDGGDIGLQLINKKVADAFAAPVGGAATVSALETPPETATPYSGYLFLEPPGVDFTSEFSLVAYPVEFGKSGSRILCIDDMGEVLEMVLERREGGLPEEGKMPALITENERPINNSDLWRPVSR